MIVSKTATFASTWGRLQGRIDRSFWSLPLAVCIAILPAGSAAASAPETLLVGDKAVEMAKLGSTFDRLQRDGFSGVVALSHRGRLVFARAAGHALAGVPMKVDTPFDIMSVTKPITSMAILKLQEQGKLSIEDPLAKWFPNAPADKRSIPLRLLMLHQAGILDYPEGFTDYTPVTAEKMADILLKAPLDFTPGSKSSYSNGSYILLAQVIERASGRTLDDYIRAEILRPAGVEGSYDPTRFAAVGGGRDHFHGEPSWVDLRRKADPKSGPFWALWGAGGLFLSAPDLVRLVRAWFEGDIVSRQAAAASTQAMIKTEDGERNLVWEIGQTPTGLKRISHGGDSFVARADVWHFRDPEVTLVVWANSISPSAHRASRELAAVLFGDFLPKPVADLPAAPEAPRDAPERKLLAEYLGALSSESRAARLHFIRTRTTVALQAKQGGADKFLTTLGRHWYGLGRPELIRMTSHPDGGTKSLMRSRESYTERLLQLTLKAERSGGQYRLSELKWEAAR